MRMAESLSIRPSVFVTLCRVVHGVGRVRFRSGLDRIAKGEQSPAEPHKQRVAEERYGQLSRCSLLESLHECEILRGEISPGNLGLYGNCGRHDHQGQLTAGSQPVLIMSREPDRRKRRISLHHKRSTTGTMILGQRSSAVHRGSQLSVFSDRPGIVFIEGASSPKVSS